MTYLSLSEAAERVPTASGKRPSNATIWRWIAEGYPVNGQRVFLRHVRFGSRLAVPENALDEFAQAVAAAWPAHTPEDRPKRKPRKPKTRTPEQRAADIAAATARIARRRAGK